MGRPGSAESTTEFFKGDTELHEPAAIADAAVEALDILIAAIKSPDGLSDEALAGLGARVAAADPDIQPKTLQERIEQIREHLTQAREEYAQCVATRQGIAFGYERVHEMGAQGPGRGLRLFGRYMGKDEQPITFFVYPRDFAIHKLPYQLRNLVQRCAIG